MPFAAIAPAPLNLLVRRRSERRAVLLGTAAVLFVAVFAWMAIANDPSLGIAFLAVVPIVLVALETGLWGAIVAAAVSVAVVLLASALEHPALSATAIGTRVVVFGAVGAAAGRFSDRMRAAYAREERLLRSGLRLSEVSTAERLEEAVAAEVLATPGVIAAAVTLGQSSDAGAEGEMRTSVPMVAHGVEVGVLEAAHETALAPEDRAALALLARQAALAAENLRLIALDGERAALESRLRDVRRELLESRSGTGLLLQAEEAEKRRLADKLHEDLAQVLSAVLLGMRMLERTGPEERSDSLRQLHEQVSSVLSEVRDVARVLRPVVLDQLGLRAGIEALARTAQEHGRIVSLELGAAAQPLAEPVETVVYRLVEDVLDQHADDAVRIALAPGRTGVELRIDGPALGEDAVLALRSRAESVGGRLDVDTGPRESSTTLRATFPAAA